jgi:hypothetical protein
MDPDGAQLGRFLITRFIATAAHDPELNRKVAIKILNDEDSSLRLLREAQALAHSPETCLGDMSPHMPISHPNVVAVHDVSLAQGACPSRWSITW